MESFRVVVGSENVRRGGWVPRIAVAGKFLARAGFKPGSHADVVTLPGKLLITPHELIPTHQAQGMIHEAVKTLRRVRNSLILAYTGLPDGSKEMLDGKTPITVGPELKAILACILTDNLEPAIDALKEASSITNEDLREDFYIAREGRLPYPPLNPLHPPL